MQRLICFLLFRLSRYNVFQSLATRVIRQLQYLQGIGSGAPAGTSGEAMVIERLSTLTREKPLVVFDVGANRGQFLTLLTHGLEDQTHEIHAFEPGSSAFMTLQSAFKEMPHVHLNQQALGAACGTMNLYFDKPGSTLSSLYERQMTNPSLTFKSNETVTVVSLDKYCENHHISHIDLLKIDVEGHELEVLRGARKMLAHRRISLVTFEFGGTHIDSRVFMRDFFSFFREVGNPLLSRIIPSGRTLPLWHYNESVEQFQTSNYLVDFRTDVST